MTAAVPEMLGGEVFVEVGVVAINRAHLYGSLRFGPAVLGFLTH